MLKIVIDAGHGKNTAGKRCLKKIDSNETREWALNDKIADKLEKLLAYYDCSVLRVDDTTGAIDVAVKDRTKKANSWGADVYISIHHDSGIYGKSGGGTTVFYYSSNPLRERQAQALYDAVVKNTGLKGNRSTPVKKNGFYVLKHTNAPAFLIENGFMDSTTDTPIILTDVHATETAHAILNFLIDVFNLKKETVIETENNSKSLYKVQCGAFSNKANAEALRKKLKDAGFEAVLVDG